MSPQSFCIGIRKQRNETSLPLAQSYKITVYEANCLVWPTRYHFLKVRVPCSSVTQLLWHRPVHQNVAGSILGQGTSLGCGPNPQQGKMQEAADGCLIPTSTFLSL